MLTQKELDAIANMDAQIERHSLFEPGDGNYHGSRDYAMQSIPCEVVSCQVNRGGQCASPASIKIMANGKCGWAEEALAKAYKEVKKKIPVDGD